MRIRRLFKWSALTLLTLALLSALFVWHSMRFKPVSIRIFYERVFLEYVLDDPEMLSRMRILAPLGLRFFNDDLTDASLARGDALRAKLKADYATLQSYDRSKLDKSGQLSYDMLEYFLGQQVKSEPFDYHNYPVNQLFGVQNGLPDFMVQAHEIKDERDARDYISRLSKVRLKFDQVLEGLKFRAERGIKPPQFVVEKVLTEMRGFIAEGAENNLLYTDFRDKINKVESLSETQRSDLLKEAAAAVDSSVTAAYQSLINYYDGLLAAGGLNNNGVWSLPDGDAFYAQAIEQQTTTTYSADQLHQIGLSEVARIQAEMDQILTGAGYLAEVPSADDPTVMTPRSFAERMQALATSPDQLYPDTDEGRAQILRDYQTIIDEISAGLDPLFRVRPRSGVEVKRVPEFREKTAPGAYYQPPALDGSRPGVFFANLRDVAEIPKFGMRTLAYHEGVPGHHFQIAIMQELKGVPMFRRMLPFTAFSEGWALYTEQLAWEAGFQSNPLDNLGRLQGELFRAVRLVVDTGMHAKRWTREQAIDYMRANTGMGEKEVTAEIERYLVMPGQALAYKVGMLKILELRERAKTKLGDDFDLRDFHDLLLKNGSMPMTLLERQVDEWISAGGGIPAA